MRGFKDVTVALIDAQGCPRVQQKIRGSFSKPEVEKPSILTSLAGPARKLLRQTKSLFGGHCDVFYAGSWHRLISVAATAVPLTGTR